MQEAYVGAAYVNFSRTRCELNSELLIFAAVMAKLIQHTCIGLLHMYILDTRSGHSQEIIMT